jgi:hypothetical protein
MSLPTPRVQHPPASPHNQNGPACSGRSLAPSAHKHAHFRNSHHALGAIALIASSVLHPMPGVQCPAIGVRDEHRLWTIRMHQRGSIAAVGHVHSHSQLVHALHNSNAKIRQTFISPLGGPITDQRSGVVCQLRHSLPQAVKIVDIVDVPKIFGVLHRGGCLLSRALIPSVAMAYHVRTSGHVEPEKYCSQTEFQRFQVDVGTRADCNVKTLIPDSL